MLDLLQTLTCSIHIDPIVPGVVRELVTLIKIAIPIGLVIFGMLDLGKAVISNDEKTMKEGQSKFIKRCLYAVIIFFIVAIVQLVVNTIATAGDETETDYTDCIACFVSSSEKCWTGATDEDTDEDTEE